MLRRQRGQSLFRSTLVYSSIDQGDMELLLGKELLFMVYVVQIRKTIKLCCLANSPYEDAVLKILLPFYLQPRTKLQPSHTANTVTVNISR